MVLLLSVAFWWPLMRGITRSLGQLTSATEQIADGRFDTRVPDARRDEIGKLGESVNRMATRLDAQMTGQLTLGYRSGEAASDSVLARSGEPVRGHEFHRTAVQPEHGPQPAWRWPAGPVAGRIEGHVQGNVIASYLHVHWASRPGAARRFAAAAASIHDRGEPPADSAGNLPRSRKYAQSGERS